jgi:uncharacterized membrane protein
MRLINSLKPLIKSIEGKLLLTSFILTIFLFIYIFYCWLIDPKLYQSVVAIVVSDILFGRAAGISIGYVMKMSEIDIVVLNFYVELITIFTVYPLFILSWKKLFVMDSTQSHMQKIKDSAIKYKPYIQKYGLFGLFIFVLFPFFMTGPIIGSAIGYIMGFSHFITLSTVIISTFIAIILWALFIEQIKHLLASINENAFIFTIFIIICLLIIFYIYKRFKREE